LPTASRIRSSAASTSINPSVDPTAGGGRSRSDAHPTPIVPLGNLPDRYATAIGTSFGCRRRRHEASSSVFALRERVFPIAADVATISSSNAMCTRSLPEPEGRQQLRLELPIIGPRSSAFTSSRTPPCIVST
jgi:hypothetical protein